MGVSPFQVKCQSGFVLPNGKILIFLDIWREWMAWMTCQIGEAEENKFL